MSTKELAAWLVSECEKRNLSWAEASRRAQISPNTISDVVNGATIGTKRILALAELFEMPAEEAFRLAGLLPPLPDNGDIGALARAQMQELVEIWREVEKVDPEAADKLRRIAIIQAEAFRVAIHAAEQREIEERSEHTAK